MGESMMALVWEEVQFFFERKYESEFGILGGGGMNDGSGLGGGAVFFLTQV
jgi:hypothetical protein